MKKVVEPFFLTEIVKGRRNLLKAETKLNKIGKKT